MSLHTSLAAHKVFQKCEELNQASLQGIWTPTHEDSYHKLNETITRAMLHAENQLKKTYTGKFSWSPYLKAAVQAYHFWRLKLKESKGQLVSLAILTHHCIEGAVAQTYISCTNQPTIIQELKASYQVLLSLQKTHIQLRASYREELAEAIVLHRNGNLIFNSMSEVLKDRSLKQLKQLQF
jgi:hypothetical protein